MRQRFARCADRLGRDALASVGDGMKKRSISVLGSTGSIGTQTLDVAARQGIPVAAIAAGQNAQLFQ